MVGDLIALFGAGVASFLAPCLVPLLPAYLGIITGEAGVGDPGRAVSATAVFVLGFATVFAGLGAAAGLIGSSLHHLQQDVQRVGGIIVALMGLVLLGAVRGPLVREVRLIGALPKVAGPARPYMVGVAFGAAWSPCVGPLLAAALTVAADGGQAGRGALLLLAYALGIGVPFLVASLGLAAWPALAVALRRTGPRIERVAGALLVVLGVLLATNTYRYLTSYLARFTPSVRGL
ncbi:MAG TPA: cytochrome c biogenesis protein CcdA [Acidimicrobiales bacterium]|jgi:cytochrome c-type biogenesis protein|nr:cytochrome c biogenesis protein CcdA [Acidimicrobiales bacterium]